MTTPADAPYKQQQRAAEMALQIGLQMEPTIHSRLNRLNPAERNEARRIIHSMKLRKVIRRVLAEAYWSRPTNANSMQQLRSAVREQRTTSPLLNKPLTYSPEIVKGGTA